MKVVPSTYHQLVQYHIPTGTTDIRRDQVIVGYQKFTKDKVSDMDLANTEIAF